MKRKLLSVGLLLAFYYAAYAQQGNSTMTKAAEQLKVYSASHITEKAYLQFDKPYYAAGDTIYFKAYVTLGEKHALTSLSGVLNVDLINIENKIDQSIKLQINDGVAWGDFALPDTLPKGNYRIRAYTRWMRNNGDYGFFDQTIPIGSSLNNKIPESGTPGALAAKADIQFFAEGGGLVNGIRSKVAFKATGPGGLGLAAKGVITDNTGAGVTQFKTTHLGMGSFYLTPQDGKTYKAKVTFADGTVDVMDLPVAKTNGVILAVNNDSLSKASVTITANATCFNENKNKTYSLIVNSAGMVTTVPCTLDSAVVTLDILKRKLSTGIATITLFSPAGEPLCERLLYIQNYDQLNVIVKADQASYAKRQKVTIKLNMKDRADQSSAGHFSVSVTDESKVPVDENSENTILTNLLLTSDLKGYVEQPNYYFINPTDKTNSNLDLVMLTNGYRRFEWKQLLNNEHPAITYQPENSLEITGLAKTLTGAPISNGTVSLISITGGPVLTQKTDSKGNFSFRNLVFLDSTRFELNATNAKERNTTQLVYQRESGAPDLPIKNSLLLSLNSVPDIYTENNERQQEQLNRSGFGKGRMLKEVRITTRKKLEYKSASLIPTESANQVIYGDQIIYGGALSIRLLALLHGFKWVQDGLNFKPLGALILVDGAEGSIDQVSNDAVELIEVFRPPISNVYGSRAGSGVIVITTKPRTLQAKDIISTGVLSINANGFYKAREFYTPKYEHPNDGLNLKDLRTTIYWNPELITDKDGNASFDYYNADGTGNYRVVVEGIDEKGDLGRRVYRYKME